LRAAGALGPAFPGILLLLCHTTRLSPAGTAFHNIEMLDSISKICRYFSMLLLE
jgi:hypothetical protein